MNDSSCAAPLWRRLAAAVYDAPLLAGVWVVVAALFATAQLAIPGWQPAAVLRGAVALAAGTVFFGWFWTRGGQSPGMRAWKIRVQRLDGARLRWPVALIRFVAMLLVWALVLTAPVMILLWWKFGPRMGDPRYAHIAELLANALEVASFAATATIVMLALRFMDVRRRLPHDLAASVMVVRVRD